MQSIFLSHSSKDNILIGQVKERLEANGYASLFLDFDHEQGIQAGVNWEETLYSRLMACDAVVALVTPDSVASRWCFSEITFARALKKPVIPLEAGAKQPILDTIQHIQLQPDPEAGYALLLRRLEQAGLAPYEAFDLHPDRPPYPGLKAFDPQDAGVFFGRSAEIKALLDSLRGLADWPERRALAEGSEHGALAVIGPSGSGKSSLVMAGLLPRLMRDPAWHILPRMRPGAWPVDELERAFENAFKRIRQQPPPDLLEQLKDDPARLLKALRIAVPGEARFFLLFMDQFEEVFTQAGEAERKEFFNVLELLLGPRCPLRLLLTLRSENLTDALRDPFSAALLARLETVGPLDRERLAEVIEGPARRAGLSFDPGLAGRMVADTGGGDALPLLAYTLGELYERAHLARTSTIKTESYEELGGVRGALERQANLAMQALEKRRGAQVLEQVLDVLARLAALDPGGQLARRPLAARDLAPLDQEILEEFVEKRLLVTRQEGETPVVEVAHEALLRQWPPLRDRLEASADALRWWGGLERAALEWEQAGRTDAYLWPGARLAAGQRFLQDDRARLENAAPLAAFVAASQQRDQRELSRQADALASAILDSYDEDPERGIILALEGLRVYRPTPRLRRALARSLQANHFRQRFRARTSYTAAALSPDGRLVALAERGKPHRMLPVLPPLSGRKPRPAEDWPSVGIWDASSAEKLAEIRPHDSPVVFLLFSPDGTLLLSVQEDNSVCLWSAGRGDLLHTLRGADAPGEAVSRRSSPGKFAALFSADGAQVLFCWKGTGTLHFDCQSGNQLETPILREVADRFYERNGTPDEYYQIEWKPIPVKEFAHWGVHLPLTAYLLTHPDTQVLDPSGKTCIRDNELQDIKLEIRAGFLVSAHLDADVQRGAVATAAENTGIRIGVYNPFYLRGHRDPIFEIHLNEAGDRLLSADHHEARLWALPYMPGEWGKPDGLAVYSLDGRYQNMAVSPSGEEAWLIGGKNILAYPLKGGAPRRSLELSDSEYPIRFTADHQRLIVRCPDQGPEVPSRKNFNELLRFYELSTGNLLQEITLKPLEYRGSPLLSDDGLLLARTSSYWLDLSPAGDLSSRRELPGSVLPGEGELDSYTSVLFSPNGRRLAAATAGYKLKVWDTQRFEIILDTFGRKKLIMAPDSARLLAYDYGQASIFALPEGEISRFEVDNGIEAATFSPDGSQVAVGCLDQGGWVFDAVSGELIQDLPPPIPAGAYVEKTRFLDIAFFPDGRRIAGLLSNSSGDTLVTWEVPTLEDLQSRAQALPLRLLDPDERKRYGLAT